MKAWTHSLIHSRVALLCGLLSLLIGPAVSQERVSSALFKADPVSQTPFFRLLPDSLKADSASVVFIRSKSPTTAVLLSAILPGAGQIYTGRYWKVPLILGFGGYFGTQWFRMNDRYTESRSRYDESVKLGANNGQGDAQLLYERDFYHDERDRFAFYFAITYLLNLVDAYVGASLYGFDVGDNLGGTSLKISIPIR
ncbi:MAG: DUF5683 domain-containing protein [Ignavibacteriales bacterium]|nr:DUF5683 domain-containing protein [Ignavibacteriales bacterium]